MGTYDQRKTVHIVSSSGWKKSQKYEADQQRSDCNGPSRVKGQVPRRPCGMSTVRTPHPRWFAHVLVGYERLQVQREIQASLDRRPDISRPVLHAILSAPAQDQVTAREWSEMVGEYMERMGYAEVPYVAVRHKDTEHDHVHIVASRVRPDEKVVSDSFEMYRSQEIMRDFEERLSLTKVRSSWEVKRQRKSQNEYHYTKRTGEKSTRESLRDDLQDAPRDQPGHPGTCASLAQKRRRARATSHLG